jgi:hypothetical protein
LLDQSLKYLPDSSSSGRLDAACEPFVEILQAETAEVLEGGKEKHLRLADGLISDHDKNLSPSIQVARHSAYLCRLHQHTTSTDRAPHRGSEWTVGFRYFPHALVTVDSVYAAHMVASQLNKFFDENRGQYPLSEGWRAEAHHQGDSKKKIKPNPLTEGSPWLRSARELDFGIDEKCARIMIVDAQCREGTSNPACLVVGVGRPVGSLLEIIQRIARAFGACHDKDRKLCPPLPLDQPITVSHGCYEGNADIISRGMNYMINMRAHLGELLPLDEYMEAVLDASIVKVPLPKLESREKRKVVQEVASLLFPAPPREGVDPPPPPATWVDVFEKVEQYAKTAWPTNEAKRKEAVEIVKALEADPKEAERIMDISGEITPQTTVRQEDLNLKVSLDMLWAWCQMRGVELTREDLEIPSTRKAMLHWYAVDHQVRVDDQAVLCPMSDITKQVGGSELAELTRDMTPALRGKAIALATSAVRRLLGVPPGEVLRDHGRYDTVQTQHLVYRGMDQIRRHVRKRLLSDRSITALRSTQDFVFGPGAGEQQEVA